jgi:hypothetical protein
LALLGGGKAEQKREKTVEKIKGKKMQMNITR